jgi:hypothetical protein
MKKYSLCAVLFIAYLLGLIAAISFIHHNAGQVTVTMGETEASEAEDSEAETSDVAIFDAEIYNTETSDTGATDVEASEAESSDAATSDANVSDAETSEPEASEPEAKEDENGDSSDEALNLPAVYNVGKDSSLRLNLREAPSRQAKITGKCKFGESLTVLSYVDDEWVQVEYQDKTYYCSRACLTISDGE